ncbi:hypothetical protein WN944_026449 [Citrus x changshan-huyou]|uniref:Uncharacterized protein n=1 Tax=Citrus x changshan-huyou TaxID=2935761 RepID=A0AAP0LUF2_9ROSI
MKSSRHQHKNPQPLFTVATDLRRQRQTNRCRLARKRAKTRAQLSDGLGSVASNCSTCSARCWPRWPRALLATLSAAPPLANAGRVRCFAACSVARAAAACPVIYAPRSRSATTTPVRSRSVTTTLVRSRTVTNDLPDYDSGEPDNPNSLEGKTTQQTDADNQYVSAVNGMLDASPRRSSSGQTLASHTTHMGRDSPTFSYIYEIKDHSPNSSNLGGMFSNNANRLPSICVACK